MVENKRSPTDEVGFKAEKPLNGNRGIPRAQKTRTTVGCIDRDERAAKGDDGAMVGMLRGLRVDARCLATFPQHPSWTTAAATATAPIHTAAIDDFHDHCCRRCCASAIIQDRYLAPRRLLFSIRRDFCVYRSTRARFFSRRILESDSLHQNWKLEFACN